MPDPEKQATFVSGLRKTIEDAAPKNPTLADMRALARAPVAEERARIAGGQPYSPLGAHLGKDGSVSLLKPEIADADEARADILLTLGNLAKEGNIRAAAFCEVLDKQVPGGSIVKFIQVHMEHVVGKAVVSAVPADESVLLAAAPEVHGPAIGIFGGATQPRIFTGRS